MYVFLFANRRSFCLAAAAIRADKGAGVAARPRAEILASCAAQRAAFSRHCRMRETALLLYDRYFSGTSPAGERVSRLPRTRRGLRAIMNDGSGFRIGPRSPTIDRRSWSQL